MATARVELLLIGATHSSFSNLSVEDGAIQLLHRWRDAL